MRVHPLHLHQELRLDPPRRLALALAAGAAEGVDLWSTREAGSAEASAVSIGVR